MKRSGSSDLPLHYGVVPPWLASRMAKLGLLITESIMQEYGRDAFLSRLGSPFWFQSLGAVMGMDWHSSGITTSVMSALKKAINPQAQSLGLYVVGGKGSESRKAPDELLRVAETTGLDGQYLVHCSKLSAKVDNTAVQDGFQLYMHNMIVSCEGKWTVIQQGMNDLSSTARRYHWHSSNIHSFVEEPHTAICGESQGTILNMVDRQAAPVRNATLQITREAPEKMMQEIQQLLMPAHHDVRVEDVDLKRLGTILWLAHDQYPKDFESLLLMQGVGPRTIQSLALVSEVIHGTPSRFTDPARFSFAHGGKDGHPFPVPLKVYDETISLLHAAVDKSKMGITEKSDAIKRLHTLAEKAEKDFVPEDRFQEWVEKERNESWKFGGMTVIGKAKPPKQSLQLRMF